MSYKKCAGRLLEQDDFLLVTHKNPDGDCMGSAAALCSALRRKGKRAFLYPNPQTNRKLLPFVEEFFAPADFVPRYTVAVDVADRNMLAQGFDGSVDLMLDHHPTEKDRGVPSLVHPEKASCGQVVLKLLQSMGLKPTVQEANLLYIALSTDCGCFRYANTDAAALEAAAELLRCGAENHRLNELFFNKLSPARMKLEGMIYDSMGFYRNGELVIALVTNDMMARAGADLEDCDDLAGIAGRAAGSRMSITIRELEDGGSKVSVRSQPGLSSREVCLAFGGGGHELAAGCSIDATPKRARELLLAVVNEVWK